MLKFLDLSHNSFKDAGATYMAQMLLQNGTLTILFLHWNNLGAKGGAELAKSLCKNQTIQILDISYCNMGGARGSLDKQIEEEIKV